MKILKLVSLLLCLVLVCSAMLVGCGPVQNPDGENGEGTGTGTGTGTGSGTGSGTQANAAVVAIAGDYDLNAAAFGMPLSWYIRIGADETFKISTKRNYSDDKGHGTVTENNGTFVFVYSDSTNTEPKMSTFTVVNGNLVFSTPVYVGAATVASDDANNPVKALTLKNEAVLGEYVGSFTKMAMGTPLTYNYTLTLKAGNAYEILSTYVMGGNKNSFIETGVFSLENGTLTLTPEKQTDMEGNLADAADKTPVAGTLANGQITTTIKSSAMASTRQEVTLDFAVTAAYAGEYSAKKVTPMGPMGNMTVIATLVLDKIGGYTYTCEAQTPMGNSNYAEKGSFAVVDGVITLTATHVMGETEYEPVTEPTPVSGTVASYVLTAKMPTGGMATDLTFYHEDMQGTFTASNEGEVETGDPVYTATLTLLADGTYTLAIQKDGADSNSLNGAFTVTAGMGVMLQLTYSEGTLIGMVADGAINLQNIPVDGVGTEISFGFER